MNQRQHLSIWSRLKLPTPLFFRRVRAVGAALSALGFVLTTTHVALPALVVALGSYLILAGSVAAAISSVAVEPEREQQDGFGRPASAAPVREPNPPAAL